jgi:hypothetical protein
MDVCNGEFFTFSIDTIFCTIDLIRIIREDDGVLLTAKNKGDFQPSSIVDKFSGILLDIDKTVSGKISNTLKKKIQRKVAQLFPVIGNPG